MAELDPFEHLEVQDIEVNSVNADLAFWESSTAYLGPSEVYADTPTSCGFQLQPAFNCEPEAAINIVPSGQKVGKKKRGKISNGNVGVRHRDDGD